MKSLILLLLPLIFSSAMHAQTALDCQREADASNQTIEADPDGENADFKRYFFVTLREDGSKWYTGLCYVFFGNKRAFRENDIRHPKPENMCNSIIDVDSLSVAETVPIAGSTDVLRYDTAYAGRPVEFGIKVGLTDSPYDPRLDYIDVSGTVGGQSFAQHFGTMADGLVFDLLWDGNDGSGHPVQGSTMASIVVDQRYTGYVGFSAPHTFRIPVGSFRAQLLGLGGLTLSSVHFYDSLRGEMATGDGTTADVHALHVNEDLLGRLSNAGGNSVSFTYFLVPDHERGEAYVFSHSGLHLQTRSLRTNSVLKQMSYDSAGRLLSVMDAFGNATLVNRVSSALTEIQAPFGQVTKLHLDGNGRVADVEDPMGHHYLISYNGAGLMSSFQKPGGAVNTFTYGTTGVLTQDAHSGGSVLNFNKTSSRIGNRSNSDINIVSALGIARNAAVGTDITDAGYSRRTSQPGGSYQGFALIKRPDYKIYESVSPFGRVTTRRMIQDLRFGSDIFYHNNTGITSGNQTFSLQINRADVNSTGDILTLDSTNQSYILAGHTTHLDYVGSTQTETMTSPLGRTGFVKYNGFDQVIQAKSASFAPVDFGYDTAGRVNLISQGARLTHFGYDASGNLVSVTNPLSQTTAFTHDSNGQIITTTLPDGRIVQTGHDANGNLSQVQTPSGVVHELLSNAFDFLGSYVAPTMNSTSFVTNYEYDNGRRLKKITKPDGVEVSLTYDPTKEYLKQVTTPEGTTTYNYDYLGLMERIDTTQGVTTHLAYNGDIPYYIRSQWTGVNASVADTHTRLQQTSTTVNDSVGTISRVDLSYDDDDLLTTAGDMSIARDSATGMIAGTSLGNVQETFSYDSTYGEISQYRALYSGTEIFKETYTRDLLGRLSGKSTTVNSVTTNWGYIYDSAGRLIQVWKDSALLRTYLYDANSNRLKVTQGTKKTLGSYDAQDRLLTYGQRIYEYTGAGDRSLKYNDNNESKLEYTYDALGALTQAIKRVKLSDGTWTNYTFTYLNDGRRLRVERKKDGVIQQRYIYDQSGRLVAELKPADGSLLWHYVYATRSHVPDYMINKNGVKFKIIHDHLGSVRLVVNTANGLVKSQIDYDEFGRVEDASVGVTYQPFGFAGGIYDSATGLVRFGARDYDPVVGRWTAKDPILFGGGDVNLYGYVMSDPINFIDPSGLSAADVGRIYAGFNQTVGNLNNLGLRSSNGFWNNFTRGNGMSDNLGCYEQANEAKRNLENQRYDDQWNFTETGSNWPLSPYPGGGMNIGPHHWVEGTSNNPSDPRLIIDPWRGTITPIGGR